MDLLCCGYKCRWAKTNLLRENQPICRIDRHNCKICTGMSEQNSPSKMTENNGLEKMCACYDNILVSLQEFEAFSASQIICNVVNEHIKRLTMVIQKHNEIAATAEKSMEALADGLRRLRLQAQQVVDDNHNHVIRMTSDERDPVYTGEG